MSVLEELARLHSTNPTVITVGVFDGVHKGHQYLIGCLKESAVRQGCSSAVITFTNHPRTVMRPDVRVPLLSTAEDRLRLLAEQGVDLVVPLSFTPDLSYLRAREFVELLKDVLNMRGLVVGPDFAFGYQREGTPEVLAQLGQEMGFTVEVVQPVEFEGRVVSSSAVRSCVEDGNMAEAAWMLGRPFTLAGYVVEGDRRGREMGFPTANLEIGSGIVLPADGIYATWTQADGVTYASATNIGFRPTFGPGGRQVETHLIDYSGDLYNAKIQVAFARKLREEMKFNGVESLVSQMHEDVAQAQAALTEDEWMLPSNW